MCFLVNICHMHSMLHCIRNCVYLCLWMWICRELHKLDSITRTPLLSHCVETVAGLRTIRAFRLVQFSRRTYHHFLSYMSYENLSAWARLNKFIWLTGLFSKLLMVVACKWLLVCQRWKSILGRDGETYRPQQQHSSVAEHCKQIHRSPIGQSLGFSMFLFYARFKDLYICNCFYFSQY